METKDKQLVFVLVLLAIMGSMALYLFLVSKGLDLNKLQITIDKIQSGQSAPTYPNKIKLTSGVFENDKDIPAKYTCSGTDVNPPFNVSDVPANAKSLALVVEDPDAPYKTWTHWIVYNIPTNVKIIYEKSVPYKAVLGENDFGVAQYRGPCPPIGRHKYVFRLYALDTVFDYKEGLDRKEFEDMIKGHVVDVAELKATFEKPITNK